MREETDEERKEMKTIFFWGRFENFWLALGEKAWEIALYAETENYAKLGEWGSGRGRGYKV